MMFLVTDEGVVAVDAPPTLGNNIIRAITSVTPLEVTHAIYSHHHADHAGAMILYDGAVVHGHDETARLLRQMADPNRPVPGQTFSESMILAVGPDTLELHYHGPIHSPGNTFVYARTAGWNRRVHGHERVDACRVAPRGRRPSRPVRDPRVMVEYRLPELTRDHSAPEPHLARSRSTFRVVADRPDRAVNVNPVDEPDR